MVESPAGPPYRYGGARVLVEMHEEELRAFLELWRRAREAGVSLPATDDPSYASMEALLAHVLGCAARYLCWMCERLEVEVPALDQRPEASGLADRADTYLAEILAAWRVPLRTMTEEQAYQPSHTSRWGSEYCLDGMLEHAVMHPRRHARQLRGLMPGA